MWRAACVLRVARVLRGLGVETLLYLGTRCVQALGDSLRGGFDAAVVARLLGLGGGDAWRRAGRMSMRFRAALALAAVLAGAAIAAGARAQTAPLPAEVKETNREIVREYLLENPEIIEKVMIAFNARRQAEKRAKARVAIATNRAALIEHPMSPVVACNVDHLHPHVLRRLAGREELGPALRHVVLVRHRRAVRRRRVDRHRR